MYLDEGQRLGEIGATQFASNLQGRAQTVYLAIPRSRGKKALALANIDHLGGNKLRSHHNGKLLKCRMTIIKSKEAMMIAQLRK